MTRRPPAAPLILGVAVLVIAGAWWLADNPLRDDSAASAQAASPQSHVPPTDTAPEIVEHALPSTVESLPALDHKGDDGGFSGQDLWAHISDPANSDLPPELFAELSQLGADIVRADATGQGRHRWPHHWATDNDHQGMRAEPCCTDITIHAAGAYTHPTDPDIVQVTVIWTGTRPSGPTLVERISHIPLRYGTGYAASPIHRD